MRRRNEVDGFTVSSGVLGRNERCLGRSIAKIDERRYRGGVGTRRSPE
jgi:hypothetical protein